MSAASDLPRQPINSASVSTFSSVPGVTASTMDRYRTSLASTLLHQEMRVDPRTASSNATVSIGKSGDPTTNSARLSGGDRDIHRIHSHDNQTYKRDSFQVNNKLELQSYSSSTTCKYCLEVSVTLQKLLRENQELTSKIAAMEDQHRLTERTLQSSLSQLKSTTHRDMLTTQHRLDLALKEIEAASSAKERSDTRLMQLEEEWRNDKKKWELQQLDLEKEIVMLSDQIQDLVRKNRRDAEEASRIAEDHAKTAFAEKFKDFESKMSTLRIDMSSRESEIDILKQQLDRTTHQLEDTKKSIEEERLLSKRQSLLLETDRDEIIRLREMVVVAEKDANRLRQELEASLIKERKYHRSMDIDGYIGHLPHRADTILASGRTGNAGYTDRHPTTCRVNDSRGALNELCSPHHYKYHSNPNPSYRSYDIHSSHYHDALDPYKPSVGSSSLARDRPRLSTVGVEKADRARDVGRPGSGSGNTRRYGAEKKGEKKAKKPWLSDSD